MAHEFLNSFDVIVRLQQVGIGFDVMCVAAHRAFSYKYSGNDVLSTIACRARKDCWDNPWGCRKDALFSGAPQFRSAETPEYIVSALH
jgi:hypothetical protein